MTMDPNSTGARPSPVRVALASSAVTASFVVLAILATPGGLAIAQNTASPSLNGCIGAGAKFDNPPEIGSPNGILRGEIFLSHEQQWLPRAELGGDITCSIQLVRNFRKTPPKEPFDRNTVGHPMPGPTLRAHVGGLIQLTFVNQIDSKLFGRDLDIEDCVRNSQYPAPFNDHPPNCIHGSSTANIHFHGTHTNPNSTGDNVYLQIRPLPRDNDGTLPSNAVAEGTAGLDDFFRACALELKNPLNAWPVTWDNLPTKEWTNKQTEWLKAYQQKFSGQPEYQPVWQKDEDVLKDRGWPIYYIGAFPHCFALPAYTVTEKDDQGKIKWPPPPGSTSPIMGQVPGTQWYHAHKHGSTAINVANGMTGAFIIEGDYDRDLNEAYRNYTLSSGAWTARSQKVLVLNQLSTVPNIQRGGGDTGRNNPGGPDFSVNGRLRPTVEMQPGEIQLWRIVNTSGRTAVYFMPQGLEWQQIAQDGVQYAPRRYENGANLNKPFYMAPANRVDLLVRAPKEIGKSHKVLIQNVLGRSAVQPNPNNPDPPPEIVLLSINVIGPAVMKDGQPTEEMPFLTEKTAPILPAFLTDITEGELRRSDSTPRTFLFDSKKPRQPRQHTINGIQFDEAGSNVDIQLGATEEWIVKNATTQPTGPGNSPIDHPLHIHINPFQVTEVFDPNEVLTDPAGKPVIQGDQPMWRYFLTGEDRLHSSQCELDPKDEATWREGGKLLAQQGDDHPCRKKREADPVWWDVFAIPAGRALQDANNTVIPGHYKMRSRFVDYPGLYVMHCHILIHEDRGMMFRVEVLKGKPVPSGVRHH